MNLILPYEEKLYRSRGAFITPAGKILYVNKLHEDFAKNYCLNNLNKKELFYLKKWLETKDGVSCCYTDFLTLMLSFDKVESIIKKVITTTSIVPHVRFYNYFLMNWRIDTYVRLHYDQDKDAINPVYENEFFSHSLDREKEEEILEIKSKVPLKDRHLFLK